MKRSKWKIIPVLMIMGFLLSGCGIPMNTIIAGYQTNPATPAANGLINDWLSSYTCSLTSEGMLCFDWSHYQPSTGTAYICYERQASGETVRHTSAGNTVMESFERGPVYRIAIWYGDSSQIQAVQRNGIPDSAWRCFYINQRGEVVSATREQFGRSAPVATPIPTIAPDNSWHLQFTGINRERDEMDHDADLRVGDKVYFHARLTGGSPSAKIRLCYEISMNGECIESSSFQDAFGDGSNIWVSHTPYQYGTLSIRIFYYDGNGFEVDLGRTSVSVAARSDDTQSKIAQGWISDCDVYFNRYGSLCFDLSNYEPRDDAIICFSKRQSSDHMIQGTGASQMVWDTPEPGEIYAYAIWSGVNDSQYVRNVASLSYHQIPSYAWIELYVTADRQVVILSSDVNVRIRQNEQDASADNRNDSSALSRLPELDRISTASIVGNGDIPVYTGPSTGYYRSASGNGAVSSGETVSVFGRTGDWVLIQYNAWHSVRKLNISRFAYIPASQIERGLKYAEVQLGSVPIRISGSAMIADEPATTHAYNSFDSWENDHAVALARIRMNGDVWIYFESYATSSQGYRPFRGFAEERYVTVR